MKTTLEIHMEVINTERLQKAEKIFIEARDAYHKALKELDYALAEVEPGLTGSQPVSGGK